VKQTTLAANQQFATKNPAWVSLIRSMRTVTVDRHMADRCGEILFSLTGPHRQLRNNRPSTGMMPGRAAGENGDFFDIPEHVRS
jgi:hypothetical protein